MKIWYQSASSYRYEPIWDEYGKALEVQCKSAARLDTEVYVAGVPVMVHEIDKYKSLMYYHKIQILNNMLKAEKEGYDAFVIGCSADAGLEEGREMLSIPVVGITHASMYVAAMLGERFAAISREDYIAERYLQQVKRYGLQSKYLQGNYYFKASEEELASAFKNPGPVMESFKAVAERAVADGASVIIPQATFIALLAYKTGLTKVGNVPIIDIVGVAVKTAEMLVDLKKMGIEVSRKLQVYGSPGKELLKEAIGKYAKVFKAEY